ncbi:MAG: hypothetical protein KIT43_06475 [Bauldia sp.]|nr:hypothetical protein [Bauldia sp.]MCW5717266.1 hypothetical protein [Bauldia sp.]
MKKTYRVLSQRAAKKKPVAAGVKIPVQPDSGTSRGSLSGMKFARVMRSLTDELVTAIEKEHSVRYSAKVKDAARKATVVTAKNNVIKEVKRQQSIR